jgi:hypothetical protein
MLPSVAYGFDGHARQVERRRSAAVDKTREKRRRDRGRCWKATTCADTNREWAGNCYVRRRAYRRAFAKQDRRRRRQRVDCAYRSSPGRQVIRRNRSRLQSHNNSSPRVAHNIRLPLYSIGQGPLQCKKRTQGCISSLVPILEAGSLMLYPLQRTRQIALAIKGLASSQLGVALSRSWLSFLTGTVIFFEMATFWRKCWADKVRQ